uniref:Uncharacterized protein n=1 Tax=Panagrellus redivivus TaxID=6233 RepID=A0A7E4VEL0_PANRE
MVFRLPGQSAASGIHVKSTELDAIRAWSLFECPETKVTYVFPTTTTDENESPEETREKSEYLDPFFNQTGGSNVLGASFREWRERKESLLRFSVCDLRPTVHLASVCNHALVNCLKSIKNGAIVGFPGLNGH